MTLRVVTPPAEALLSADLLKLALSIEGVADWDALLALYLPAAINQLQSATQRRFLAQDLEWSLPGWPCEFVLPVAPVAADGVSEIVYADVNGAEQTLPADRYVVSPHGPTVCIRPTFGTTWPLLDPDAAEGVIVRFTAGEAAADVSAGVKVAAAMLVAIMHANRGDDAPPPLAASTFPAIVEPLIADERW